MEARAIKVVIDGVEYWAERKRFRTGSVGYFSSGKVFIEGVRHQMQVQLVEVGSKGNIPAVPMATNVVGSPQADQTELVEFITDKDDLRQSTVPVGNVDVANRSIRPSPGGGDTILPGTVESPPAKPRTRRKGKE